MRARFPVRFFVVLAVALAASTCYLARWQRAQHACTCTLGGADYFTADAREDCAVHGTKEP